MNKRFWISVVVIFLLYMGLDFLVHAVLLHPDYLKLPHLYRTENDAQNYFPLMLLAHVLMAAAFVWIYQKGKEEKPFLQQGIRFGIAIALLARIPTYMIYYAVQPLPFDLVMKQIAFGFVVMVLLGIAVAWLNR